LNSIAVLLAHDVAIAWVETGSSTGISMFALIAGREGGEWY